MSSVSSVEVSKCRAGVGGVGGVDGVGGVEEPCDRSKIIHVLEDKHAVSMRRTVRCSWPALTSRRGLASCVGLAARAALETESVSAS